ncbi:cell division regulator GpsB [Apilactobacillus sp. TMW 2.2459]|uniref:cell division regulator GpsB n=1 Tax=Apilactobacillus xinyiensis TaxID=2841032 RepID=UPI00200CE9C0|nr:cell division regulator GpsB [Apilactobacillus xinyiensis]MCL0311718.1 cell division regulator GpsB [Apilactobacillus xinyiensis]
MNNMQFNPTDILQKEFKQKMRGYDPAEVDSFLDNIIKDYENFDNVLQNLKNENNQLKSRITDLNNQLASAQNATNGSRNNYDYSAKPNYSEQNTNINNNVDILKRLSNLERKVFGGSDNMNRY